MLKKAMNNKETYRYISRAKFTIKSAVKGEKVYRCWLAIVLGVTTGFPNCRTRYVNVRNKFATYYMYFL